MWICCTLDTWNTIICRIHTFSPRLWGFYHYCCCTLEFMLISFCKSLVFIRFCFSSICIISFTCLFILLPQFVIYGLEREKMVNKDGDKELFFPIAAKLIWNYNKVATTQCHLSFWHCVNKTKLIIQGQGPWYLEDKRLFFGIPNIHNFCIGILKDTWVAAFLGEKVRGYVTVSDSWPQINQG